MFELIKTLSGHSGCRLNLYKDGSKVLLRKDAGKPDYNRRLKKQFIKQKLFKLAEVKTPVIYDYGLDKNGVFYFDMEFINGITLAESMKSIKIKEIVDLIGLLFRSLPISDGVINTKSQEIFQNKISALSRTCDIANPNVAEALAMLRDFDFSGVPQSACCGDLTLENILLGSTDIYIIDLLDSFYNSWMIDVAKLLQDLELGWSYRNQQTDFNLNLRLATAKQALFDNLLAINGGKQYLFVIYHILLLNVLRIYPYTKDEKTMDFLDSAVQKVISVIREMEK